MNPVANEPVLTAITGLLGSLAAFGLACGVHLTGLQISSGIHVLEGAYLLAFLLRAQVTPRAHLPAPPAA